jgi:hypothetical protein
MHPLAGIYDHVYDRVTGRSTRSSVNLPQGTVTGTSSNVM